MASKNKASKLFDNKQLVHIGSEIVVLLGLTFYFSSKNKKLSGHIDELAQRLEEQEDHIQKLESTIQQQLTDSFTRLQQQVTGLLEQLAQKNSAELNYRLEEHGACIREEFSELLPPRKEPPQKVLPPKSSVRKETKINQPVVNRQEIPRKLPVPGKVSQAPRVQEIVTKKVNFQNDVIDDIEDDDEESDSDLDDQIKQELDELNTS